MVKICEFKLVPCRKCGEELELLDDHHGDYWEHPNNECKNRAVQVIDEKGRDWWNKENS